MHIWEQSYSHSFVVFKGVRVFSHCKWFHSFSLGRFYSPAQIPTHATYKCDLFYYFALEEDREINAKLQHASTSDDGNGNTWRCCRYGRCYFVGCKNICNHIREVISIWSDSVAIFHSTWVALSSSLYSTLLHSTALIAWYLPYCTNCYQWRVLWKSTMLLLFLLHSFSPQFVTFCWVIVRFGRAQELHSNFFLAFS